MVDRPAGAGGVSAGGLIAYDPLRYRPLMLLAAFGAKFFFAIFLVVLLLKRIAQPHWIPPAVVDASLGVVFLIAFFIATE